MSRFPGPLLALVLLSGTSSLTAAANPIRQQADGYTLTVIRGRALCLDAAGREVETLFGCNEASQHFGFASRDGKLYRFMPADPMTPVFTDARVRQRDLQLTARLHTGGQLEVIKVQSIKQGKLYDIFYFCEVCTITAYTPGLCPCCRNELEFKETPP